MAKSSKKTPQKKSVVEEVQLPPKGSFMDFIGSVVKDANEKTKKKQ